MDRKCHLEHKLKLILLSSTRFVFCDSTLRAISGSGMDDKNPLVNRVGLSQAVARNVKFSVRRVTATTSSCAVTASQLKLEELIDEWRCSGFLPEPLP